MQLLVGRTKLHAVSAGAAAPPARSGTWEVSTDVARGATSHRVAHHGGTHRSAFLIRWRGSCHLACPDSDEIFTEMLRTIPTSGSAISGPHGPDQGLSSAPRSSRPGSSPGELDGCTGAPGLPIALLEITHGRHQRLEVPAKIASKPASASKRVVLDGD